MSDLAGKKILLVDDDRDILTAMETTLSDEGCEVSTAGDGNSAIAQAEQSAPDLVVLDMMLPKKSGFLVMERLRKLQPRPKVIMITGNQGSRHKAYAESQGVNIYLNKPFRMDKLLDAVRKLTS
jgi:DNA-binding response OmpR family regulator